MYEEITCKQEGKWEKQYMGNSEKTHKILGASC